MSQMVGADVEALRRLALQFDQSAQRLRSIAGSVSNGVQVSAWVGPVALRFRHTWDSEHSVRLRNVADALDANATLLRQNAAEQERASSSGTGSITSPGPSGDVGTEGRGRPSPDDYLQFAKASYGADLPEGWTEVSPEELKKLGISPADLRTAHGMDAMIVSDGNGHYTLIFRGSTFDDGGVDWSRENLRSGLGSGALGGILGQGAADVLGALDPGTSTEEAMNLALALKNAVGADNMVITGHSLGGRHAAAASVVTGAEAVTFNAAGLTNDDVLYARTLMGDDVSFVDYLLGRASGGNTLRSGLQVDQITNYVSSGDPLTAAQKLTPGYDAVGRQITVNGGDHHLESFDGKLQSSSGGGGR